MAMNIDIDKVKSYVLPNIDKVKSYIESAYNDINSLYNQLPGDFMYKSTVSQLSTNIYSYKINSINIKNLINTKLENAIFIENSTEQKIGDISNSMSTLDSSNEKPTPVVIEEEEVEEVSFWGDFADNWSTGWDMLFGGKEDRITFEEFLASSTNALVGVMEGMLDVVENVGDTAVALGGTMVSGGAYLYDLATGDSDFSSYNAVKDWTKATVTNDWTNELHDLYYDNYGAILDEYAIDGMKSDQGGYQIAKQGGTLLGTVAVSTMGNPIGAGSASAASQAASMAVVGATNSFGSNISNEWNKNSVTISYDGINTLDLNMDYDTYSNLEKLDTGESLNVSQSYMLEDGSIQEVIFTFVKNNDGSFSSYDSYGNVVNTHSLNESNTYKSMAKSGVKAAWDGAQYYVGSKIAGANFTSLTANIANPYLQVAAQSGMRIGLDGLTGAVEVPFQAGIDAIFDGISYKEAWNNQGGIKGLKTQTLFALGASVFGEVGSYKSNVKNSQLDNILSSGNTKLISSSLEGYKPHEISRTLSEMNTDDVINLLKVSDINTQFKFFNSMDADTFSKYYKAIESDELHVIINSMDDNAYKNLINNINDDKVSEDLLSIRKINNNVINVNAIRNYSINVAKSAVRSDGSIFNIQNMGTTTVNGKTLYMFEYSDLAANNHRILYSEMDLTKALDGSDLKMRTFITDTLLNPSRVDGKINNMSGYVGYAAYDKYGQIRKFAYLDMDRQLLEMKVDDLHNFFTQHRSKLSGYGVPQQITNVIIPSNNGMKDFSQFRKLRDKLISQGFNGQDSVLILQNMDSAGVCSYASVCNEIFNSFKDNPDLFKKTFGYSMFTYLDDGTKILNSPELLLDLFTYANHVNNGGRIISGQMGNMIVDEQIFYDRVLLGSSQQYMSSVYGKNDFLINNFLMSKNYNLEYRSKFLVNVTDKMYNKKKVVFTQEQLDYVKSVIKDQLRLGNNLGLDIYQNNKSKFSLNMYNLDNGTIVNTKCWNEGIKGQDISGHSVFITGADEGGVIVSSWGEAYYIKYEELCYTPFMLTSSSITLN